MGEIAEMMLDGSLCEGCGTYLGSDLDCPCLCQECAKERSSDGHVVEKIGKVWVDSGAQLKRGPGLLGKHNTSCPTCGKRVRIAGLADHNRVMHLKPPNV